MEGWITPDGSAYINVDWTWGGHDSSPPKPQVLPSTRSVALWKDGTIGEVVSTEDRRLLGVPTPDFSGAWIVRSGAGPTVLASHAFSGGLVEAWRDESGPLISGVFAGDSGQRLLLLQTEYVGSSPGSLRLAVWNVGQPPPAVWDRVVLNSPGSQTLVHLDVDAAATAGATVFVDPGSPQSIPTAGPPPPPTVPTLFQTAPLARFSLRQQLVITAAARTRGRFGADWRTDLLLRNPGANPLPVSIRLLPNPETSTSAPDASVTVGPNSIVVVPDALGNLFHLEQGSGALLLLPGSSTLEATSRVYTASWKGTYGMAVDAEDVIGAARPGYSQPFSAGLLGSGFRTNLLSCDLSGEGSHAKLIASASGGTAGKTLSIEVPAGGQAQLDDVAGRTGTPGSETGSFLVTTSSGAALTGFTVIDNATNDPTWFGPDVLPGPLAIPAVVHASGANRALYRTDLLLFNPDAATHAVRLYATLWNDPSKEHWAVVTIEPGESRRIPDALFTVFGLTGVARMYLDSGFPNGGVSITSRTYTLLPDGSTYGMLVPPLAASQTAGPGETLEILGPTGGAGSRTNLSLVKVYSLGSVSVVVHVQILDEKGTLLDAFDQELSAHQTGLQVDDLFRARGLGDGPKAALIRVSVPLKSPHVLAVAAYATTIDNGTNDPVYFVGHLAMRD